MTPRSQSARTAPWQAGHILRIPNPASDLTIFIRIFRELYADLQSLPEFDLDDITQAMIARRSVSSQGAVGPEALRRSTRPDRSRDPLFNQSKMYSELYRILGWIQSVSGKSKLVFAFTLLGRHMATSTVPERLARECLIGIAYPNEVIDVLADQSVRVFAAVLVAAERLSGYITRDEIIAGPMNVSDDRDAEKFDSMLTFLETCRARAGRLAAHFRSLESAYGIAKTTMENYTRFVIGAIQWAGWAAKSDGSFVLTDSGHGAVQELRSLADTRVSDYRKLAPTAQPAFIRLAFRDMLQRAGSDFAVAGFDPRADEELLTRLVGLPPGRILFSPFQQIGTRDVNDAFVLSDPQAIEPRPTVPHLLTARPVIPEAAVARGFAPIDLAVRTGDTPLPDSREVRELAQLVRDAVTANRGDTSAAVEALAARYFMARKETFYPLVVTLFQLTGYPCRLSRAGVNYERADAMIDDPRDSIPIEIKSPTEEQEISIKAVRQALENKIVLLARASRPTTRETTTLAVGFNAPNPRSDVHELIEDIYQAFDVRVAVLDLRSLLRLAIRAVTETRTLLLPDLRSARGVLHV